jgi:H+-transporting ATPase
MPSNANGDVESEAASRRPSAISYKEAKLGEYTRLVKFMSTYRGDVKADKDRGQIRESRVWYAPWKKRQFRWKYVGVRQELPDDWHFTDIHQGLSDSDVDERRRSVGFNELTAEKTNQFRKILGYFQGPILYVMEIAVLLAAGLEDWVDFGVIIGILCLNAAVGWYQEKQAEDVVASLKADIAMRSVVVRNGQEVDILARELVPGDVVS